MVRLLDAMLSGFSLESIGSLLRRTRKKWMISDGSRFQISRDTFFFRVSQSPIRPY
jgi:hypothetical protein